MDANVENTLEAMSAFCRAVWDRDNRLARAKSNLDTASKLGGVLALDTSCVHDGNYMQVQPHVIVPFIELEIIRLEQQCQEDAQKLAQIFNILM